LKRKKDKVMPYDESYASGNMPAYHNSSAPTRPGTVEPDSLRELIQKFMAGRQRNSSLGSGHPATNLMDLFRRMSPIGKEGPPAQTSGGSGGNQYTF
jgi:hypothetical protein